MTPLMMAAGYGRTNIVLMLLEKGADPRKATPGGYTALVAAVRGSQAIDRFTVGACQISTVKALQPLQASGFPPTASDDRRDGWRGSVAARK